MSQEIPKSTLLNENVFRAISYILVTLMFFCGVLTFGNLVGPYMPTWPTTAIAIVCSLIVLDRLYIYQQTKSFSILSPERMLAAGAQWIVIILVLKVVLGAIDGFSTFLQEIPLWIIDFQKYFLTPDFYLSLGVAAIVWVLSGYFAEILDEMSIKQALIERQSAVVSVEAVPRYRLLRLFFNIGAFLFLITALARINLRVVFMGEDAPILINIPALEGGGASTLLYFMFGFVLLSLTQFVSLNTRWALQGVRIEHDLALGWAFYSLLFLVILALVAVFLPTSYSQGALSFLGYWLGVLLTYVFFLIQLVMILFIFLASLPFRLMGREAPVGNPNLTTPEIPKIPVESTGTITPVAWLESLKNILVWGTLIAVIIYAIRQYMRQHQNLANSLHRLSIFSWLLRVWRWLSDLLAGSSRGWQMR